PRLRRPALGGRLAVPHHGAAEAVAGAGRLRGRGEGGGMTLRRRLLRLEGRAGPEPEPAPPLTPEEFKQRVERWVGAQTYNRGIFDADPEFRPAWSRYHRLWEVHTGGYSSLQAVWLPRQPAEFEAAR